MYVSPVNVAVCDLCGSVGCECTGLSKESFVIFCVDCFEAKLFHTVVICKIDLHSVRISIEP